MLIRHIYQADPLLCPNCGGTIKIIAFIEAHKADVIRRILEHCGLWHDLPPQAPPRPPPPTQPGEPCPEADGGITYEAMDQLEPPWES
jgi:hypothetical protein